MNFYGVIKSSSRVALYLDKGQRVLAGYISFNPEKYKDHGEEIETQVFGISIVLFDKVIEEGIFHRESDYELF